MPSLPAGLLLFLYVSQHLLCKHPEMVMTYGYLIGLMPLLELSTQDFIWYASTYFHYLEVLLETDYYSNMYL